MGLSLHRILDRRVYAGHQRPRSFDRNLVVIGAGSAGLVTAYIAAAVKSRVSLIEAHRMGGDCLYTGCVPSKTLIRTAAFLHDVRHSKALGVHTASADFDFAEVMARVRDVIATIEPHDSPERYESLGVDCIAGRARIEDPWHVRVGDRVLSSRAIVLATGGKPFIPPIPGIDDVDCLTSENLWDLDQLPDRFVILGGGPIGCEMAQAFARLGSRVTLVQKSDRLLPKEDPDVSEFIARCLAQDGVEVLTAHRATRVDGGNELVCDADGHEVRRPFDRLLVAVGRRANTADLGLEALGIPRNDDGTIQVNDYLQTRFPNILACGDVISPYQFTHSASHEAWYCAVNGLFGHLYRMKVDYRYLPWTTFVDPEVARVGLNEEQARAKGIEYETTTHDFGQSDRALAEAAGRGFVKVLTPPGKDRILGVTMVGPHAGDLIAEFVLAMKSGLGLGKILGTIHTYPTLAEVNKSVAGNWRREHQPQRLLRWLARYHRWRR